MENRETIPGNPLSLQGRTVLVTGASSGIGRETAILLGTLQARVVLVGRNLQRLEETRERMTGVDHRVESFDLTAAGLIPGWLKQLTTQTGPFDGLVHCAGIHQAIPLRVLSFEKIEEVLRANVASAMMLVKAFRQKACYVRPASLVLLSSVAGLVGQSAVSGYAASKAALIGFTRSAAMELAAEGVRVNCIAPGYVASEMTEGLREKLTPEQFKAIEVSHPLGIGTPRDVAHAAAFLLADTGRWITGTTLVVDGGFTAQ
jgi:NAD(P)-dependent dehydrogenase (short-subunit alcohol dehydrogenase family)